jgi:hypothetical protein
VPILQVSDEEGGLSRTAASELIAAMVYPRDEDKREQLFTALVTDWILKRGDDGDLALIAESAVPILFNAPNPADLYGRAIRRLQSARLAAELANLFIRAAVNHQEYRPTLTMAVDLLVHCAAEGNGTGWPIADVTDRAIWKAWKEFRPVVHLHAIWQLKPWLGVETPSTEKGVLTWPGSEDHFLVHLALAEAVRLFLVSQRILSAEETFRPPADLALPKAQLGFYSLEDWQLEVLANYRPRHSSTP